MKIGTRTKKNVLKLKITKAEVQDNFHDGRRRHVGSSSACYKVRNRHSIPIKIGRQTENCMLSLKITKAEVYT
jgi:hypothetical protein